MKKSKTTILSAIIIATLGLQSINAQDMRIASNYNAEKKAEFMK